MPGAPQENNLVRLVATLALLQAEQAALAEAIGAVAQCADFEKHVGVSFARRLQERRLVHLENALIRHEDVDPAFAALLQAEIDSAKKQLE